MHLSRLRLVCHGRLLAQPPDMHIDVELYVFEFERPRLENRVYGLLDEAPSYVVVPPGCSDAELD